MYAGMIEPAGMVASPNTMDPSSYLPPSSKPGPRINSDLVTRSLNYHGQQLTSFFKETPVFNDLDLKNVDYHVYHQRSKELRMEDRGKRLLLHRFISQNAEKLFNDNSAGSVSAADAVRLDTDQVEELAALLPPYEVFTRVHEDDRCRHFFDAIVPGDVVLCRVVQKSMSGLMLSVLCLDPVTNKSRYIEDLKIRCFCPSGEMIPASDPRDPVRSYEAGDIVRVVCLEVKLESQRLLAGMKTSGLRPELAASGAVKLGLCPPAQLPAAYSYSGEAIQRKIPFSMFLEKSVGFINPTNVSHLASELGLEVRGGSLMQGLSGKYRPETYGKSLRKEQASKWAYKHVAQGIKYFKAGNNVEAFQCLNQALTIDTDNVEGLVARGALYANNGGLEKAVEDFEKALQINRNHKNARKYLCETLIAVARNHEDENKVDSAIETYQRILTIVPDHKEALDSIYFLRGKPKDAPFRDAPIGTQGDSKNKPKLVLDEERKGERSEKKKKKKRRRHSSVSSSSSSSDTGDSPRKQKKKKEKKSKSQSKSPSPIARKPVSPFSAKMAPSDSGVPAGGVMNMPEEFQATTPAKLGMNLPLPDLRQDIERIKSQKNEAGPGVAEAAAATSHNPPPGFPMIDLTKPPPGYHPPVQAAPGPSRYEQEYDEKVRRFLHETAHGGSSAHKRRSGHSRGERSKHRSRSRSRSRRRSKRSRSSSRHRKSRKRSRSKRKRSKSQSKRNRDRSKSKSKSKASEVDKHNDSHEKSGEPILIDDDDFTKKLNDHLSNSEKRKSKSRSRSRGRKSKRSRSRSSRNSPSRSAGDRKAEKTDEPISRKSVFDRLDSDRETKVDSVVKPPSGGGMWIPTGEDSIIEGVKEAINKVEKKERRRSGDVDSRRNKRVEEQVSPEIEYEIKYDKRTGMYTRVPKEVKKKAEEPKKDDIIELESRVIRQLPDSPAAKVPTKSKSSPTRERRRSDRSRSRHRRRSRSRSRRSSSRSRHRHKHRSRSRSRRRSRRSRSRSRRSRSRSRSAGWRDREDYKKTQSALLQDQISGVREETRRLQTEREAVSRERARLLSGSGAAPSKNENTGTVKSGDEFSGLDNVMNSVLEAVAPRPSTIIPGTQTFEDLEAFLKRKKSEKLEEMKKKL